jgi:DNA-binding XRE family transcriptional regulator
MGSTYDYAGEIVEATGANIFRWASMINLVLLLILLSVFICLMVLIFRTLLKYLRSSEIRKEKNATKVSLGEAIKEHRTRCKMTQEFVAEHLGVSRQAVSKWENGTSDPSTSNLIAIAKLFEISAEELLKAVENTKNE